MTRVYARIVDRTVADEYFAVSEKAEALHDAPRQLPADAGGFGQAPPGDAPPDARQRLLCSPRRDGLPLQSICESCTFFVTTIEFRPTLERQRGDAAAKGQAAREQIFDGLLSRLDGEAS